MNYRHAYHAGNFADVLKHAVLCLILEHLKKKEQPFRVIDTHAGFGVYDLAGPEAERTGEWREGIGRLWGREIPGLEAYFSAVRHWNAGGELGVYPGSPGLSAALLRRDDRLTVCELHPEEATGLRGVFAADRRVKVVEVDGWLALGAFVPPKERRGLVLIDPPFEAPGEFDRMAEGIMNAARRWPGGTYLLWYPVKGAEQVSRFLLRIGLGGLPKTLRVELRVRASGEGDGLGATGCLIINPPFTLEPTLSALGPELCRYLGQGKGTGFVLDWTVPERPSVRAD